MFSWELKSQGLPTPRNRGPAGSPARPSNCLQALVGACHACAVLRWPAHAPMHEPQSVAKRQPPELNNSRDYTEPNACMALLSWWTSLHQPAPGTGAEQNHIPLTPPAHACSSESAKVACAAGLTPTRAAGSEEVPAPCSSASAWRKRARSAQAHARLARLHHMAGHHVQRDVRWRRARAPQAGRALGREMPARGRQQVARRILPHQQRRRRRPSPRRRAPPRVRLGARLADVAGCKGRPGCGTLCSRRLARTARVCA